MGFAERAVAACDRAMGNGTLKERHVRDVLKSKNPNVNVLVRHVGAQNHLIRRAVVRIVGRLGDTDTIMQCVHSAMQEEDLNTLRELMGALGERGVEAAEALEKMVNYEDPLVREEAIAMLRRTGQAESLMPLLFDRDEALVSRVKRYIHEQQDKQTPAADPIS